MDVRRLALLISVTLAAPVAGAADAPALPPPAARAVDYVADVQPILAKSCYSCHGPDKRRGGLRLDVKAAALQGGDSGAVILPRKSAESLLVRYVAGTVTNDGTIAGTTAGVIMREAAGSVDNSGSISGDNGIWLQAGGNVVNEAAGTITGRHNGVAVDGGTLDNVGSIGGTAAALPGSSLRSSITSSAPSPRLQPARPSGPPARREYRRGRAGPCWSCGRSHARKDNKATPRMESPERHQRPGTPGWL